MLARNIRIEEDLIDQLFNSSEKRLARALLLLARYGRHGEEPEPHQKLPRISQETLAEMTIHMRSSHPSVGIHRFSVVISMPRVSAYRVSTCSASQ